MDDQENRRNEIEQRLMFQQGRMNRATIGQIMELIDALVAEAGGCKECKCSLIVPALRAVWADINNLGWVGPVAHQMAKEAIEAIGGE